MPLPAPFILNPKVMIELGRQFSYMRSLKDQAHVAPAWLETASFTQNA
jgi:hypothetical protein